MTGVDFAKPAISIARKLSKRCKQAVRFEVMDVTKIDALQTFDFAYVSHGSLRWLPDLKSWAIAIHKHLAPNGFLYIFDIHPVVFRAREIQANGLLLCGDYLAGKPIRKTLTATHVGPLPKGVPSEVIHTDWTLAQLFGALLGSEFRICRFREHRGCSYNAHGLFPIHRDGLWYPQRRRFPIPGSFSLIAARE
jgi:SAM-dependent methyltransferase